MDRSRRRGAALERPGGGARGWRGGAGRLGLSLAVALYAGGCTCGGGGDEAPPGTGDQAASADQAGAAPAACVAFCRRANQCAREGGRPLPDGAEPCDRACAPGALYRRAPPTVWACADRPCGPAFADCSREGLLAAMRSSKTPVFPPTCLGLCHRLAWCAERTGQPGPVAEDDCRVACSDGGSLAEVPPAAHACANTPCGADLARCLEDARPPARDPG